MSESPEISLLLKALSNPLRVAMLKELMTCENCINGELVSKFPLSQSTVSQHLEVLAKARLINIRREGKRSRYYINSQMFNNQLALLKLFVGELTIKNPEPAAC